MSVAAVDKMVSQISITNILKILAPPGYETKNVLIRDPEYHENLSSIINSVPRVVLHAYFQWQIISVWAEWLHKDLDKPLKAFKDRLGGLENAQPERWRTCVSEIDNNLGWLLGASYTRRAFSLEAKEFGDRIIRDIKTIFAEKLKGIDWLSDSVKEKAAKKGECLTIAVQRRHFSHIIIVFRTLRWQVCARFDNTS
jgi:endothelin-converting enzyme